MIILCTTNPMTEEKQRENKDISRMAITHDMYLPESSTLDPMANHHVPSQNCYTWTNSQIFQHSGFFKPSIVSVLGLVTSCKEDYSIGPSPNHSTQTELY